MDPETLKILAPPTITVEDFQRAVPTMSRNAIYAAIRRGDIEVLPGRGKRKHILTAPLRRKLLGSEVAA